MQKLLGILFCFLTTLGFTQKMRNSDIQAQKYRWQEQIVIQTNRKFFITGDVLRYNLTCLSPDGTTSEISKVAYIELINDNKESVLRQKISLVHGIGNGDLYIPSILKSGNYSLIAYTQWMLNFSTEYIAQIQISLVNPFRILPMELEEESSSVAIDFYPESGYNIVGTQNLCIYQITNPDSAVIKSFKIINENGEVVYSHDKVNSPIGRFYWEPKTAGPYQVILIDENQSLFYSDIKIKSSTRGIHIERRNKSLWISTTLSKNDNGYLRIDNEQIINQQQIEVLEESLGPGLHQIRLIINNKVVGIRPLFMMPKTQNIPVEIQNKAVKMRSANRITLSPLDEPYNVCVSIQMKGMKDTENNPFQDLYFSNSGIDVKEKLFKSPEGLEMIDNLLIINQKFDEQNSDHDLLIPEMRWATFRGNLHFTDGTPVRFRMVNLCLPSQGPQLFVARTDSIGNFQITLRNVYGTQDGLFSYDGMDEDIEVQFQSNYLSDHNFIHTSQLQIPEDWLEPIKKQSIEVQLRNAYFKYNSDSTLQPAKPGIFYGSPTKSYAIADYTQLPTVKDIIREYIPEVSVRQNAGISRIHTTFISEVHDKKDSTLLLLNGIPISDPDIILKLYPSDIERIDIINKNFIVGPLNARGIIHFQTKQLKMDNIGTITNVRPIKIEGVQPIKKLFTPDYSKVDEVNSRIPDLRSELYWNPNLMIKGDPVEIGFYTSDLKGIYEVLIHGQTKSGSVIDERFEFSVEN